VRIIVGISGASGVVMGYHLLSALREQPEVETHLVVTEGARRTWELECEAPLVRLSDLADVLHYNSDLAAPISSGSYQTGGMIVIPCSMKTLAGIATGYATNLLLRAADVCLKEDRKLVLVPREMPFGKLHLHNMSRAAEVGATIIPPLLTFYNNAQTLDAQIDHIIGKILSRFGLEHKRFVAWEGSIDLPE
jgi:4-hydroxy-3-polyprenylbenzoate decarboxylase